MKIYWYGGGSAALDETDGTGSTTNSNFSEYIFFASARIARRDTSGDVFYYVADHLGSARAIAEVASGQNTATLCYDADFYPFGGEMMHTETCSQNYKFEGKERDSESGLDDFGARFYNSGSVLASTPFGRFATADWSAIPAPVPYANLSNPQTLNLYAMVSDNPETFADLDGHCGIEGDEVYPCSGWGGARGGSENCSIDGGGSAPCQLAGGIDAQCASDCNETTDGAAVQEDQETANQQAQQAANDHTAAQQQNATQTPTQLSEREVWQGIYTLFGGKKGGGPTPSSVAQALNGAGKNWTVSGKTLQKAAADAGILKAYPKIIGNIESISRNGNSVVITNRAQITSGFGVRARMDKTVSATITSVNGQPAFRNIQGVSIGAGFGPLTAWKAIHDWGP